MSKLLVTFICENRHELETVAVDLARFGVISKKEIERLLTKNSVCKKCGSKKFIYRTRYKD